MTEKLSRSEIKSEREKNVNEVEETIFDIDKIEYSLMRDDSENVVSKTTELLEKHTPEEIHNYIDLKHLRDNTYKDKSETHQYKIEKKFEKDIQNILEYMQNSSKSMLNCNFKKYTSKIKRNIYEKENEITTREKLHYERILNWLNKKRWEDKINEKSIK